MKYIFQVRLRGGLIAFADDEVLVLKGEIPETLWYEASFYLSRTALCVRTDGLVLGSITTKFMLFSDPSHCQHRTQHRRPLLRIKGLTLIHTWV